MEGLCVNAKLTHEVIGGTINICSLLRQTAIPVHNTAFLSETNLGVVLLNTVVHALMAHPTQNSAGDPLGDTGL
jgi:hypothetical protein